MTEEFRLIGLDAVLFTGYGKKKGEEMKPTTEEVLEKRAALLNCSVELIGYIAMLEARITDLENRTRETEDHLEVVQGALKSLVKTIRKLVAGL